MSKYITRTIEDIILQKLTDNKAIIIYGARQVGKSTLLKQLLKDNNSVLWLFGDQPQTQALFADISEPKIKSIIGNKKIIVID